MLPRMEKMLHQDNEVVLKEKEDMLLKALADEESEDKGKQEGEDRLSSGAEPPIDVSRLRSAVQGILFPAVEKSPAPVEAISSVPTSAAMEEKDLRAEAVLHLLRSELHKSQKELNANLRPEIKVEILGVYRRFLEALILDKPLGAFSCGLENKLSRMGLKALHSPFDKVMERGSRWDFEEQVRINSGRFRNSARHRIRCSRLEVERDIIRCQLITEMAHRRAVVRRWETSMSEVARTVRKRVGALVRSQCSTISALQKAYGSILARVRTQSASSELQAVLNRLHQKLVPSESPIGREDSVILQSSDPSPEAFLAEIGRGSASLDPAEVTVLSEFGRLAHEEAKACLAKCDRLQLQAESEHFRDMNQLDNIALSVGRKSPLSRHPTLQSTSRDLAFLQMLLDSFAVHETQT